jgi:hypothetical protein
MAHLARDTDTQDRIDQFLAYALEEWAAVPTYAAEFDSWDEFAQLDFVHEWAIRESALVVLRDYAQQGALLPGQQVRYCELLKVVAKNRPIIEKLLAD